MKKFDQLSTYLPKLEVGLPHTALTDYTDYTVANMPIYIAMWLQRFVMWLDGFWIKKWECKDRVEWIPFRLLWLIYVLKMFDKYVLNMFYKYVLKMLHKFVSWPENLVAEVAGNRNSFQMFCFNMPCHKLFFIFWLKVLVKSIFDFPAFYNNIPALFSTSFASQSKSTAVDFVFALLYQRFHLRMKHRKIQIIQILHVWHHPILKA